MGINWKLVFGLSLVGLGMAFASVYSVPPNIEPLCWVAIFLASTYFVASNAPGRYFMHAFLIVVIDCLWATLAQTLLPNTYLNRHKLQVDLYQTIHTQTGLTAQQIILISRPLIGVVIGSAVGVLALIASKYFSDGDEPATAPAVNNQTEEDKQPEEEEQYAASYQSTSSYEASEPSANTYAAASYDDPSSRVYSLAVLVNPTERQLEWINENRDDNATIIPNVMGQPIKEITFRGTRFDVTNQ